MIPTLTLGGLGKRPRVAPAISGSVVALMDSGAANGATSFTDLLGNVFSAHSTAVVQTGVTGFSGSSVFLDGSEGAYFDAPESTPTNILPAGDFTVEAFVAFHTMPTPGVGAPIVSSPDQSIQGYILRASDTALDIVFPGVTGASSPKTWVLGTVYHVAWCRQGTTQYACVDGAVTSHSFTNVVTTPAPSGIIIGSAYSGVGITHANISFRITRGLARYTSAYTPPSAPFSA